MYVKLVEPRRVRVLLSGGLDSTVSLAWALQQFGKEAVEALTVHYGQRHRKEVEAARSIARATNTPWALVEIPTMGGSALTTARGLPLDGEHVVVLGRNRVLLEVAASGLGLTPPRLWQPLTPTDLVFGACKDDWALFEDCRSDFFAEIQKGLDPQIHTPVLYLNKAQIIALAAELGATSLLALTWSCYAGEETACGTCLACKTRAAGFQTAGMLDPALNPPRAHHPGEVPPALDCD